jgi:DNA-directed RNA polymerase specialized sigma24 family protein
VRSDRAEVRQSGLEALVAVYWKPVYKYLRIKWHASSDEASDMTQEFFARAIEKQFFDAFDATKGRFRTFLRTCVDRYAANERKAAGRLKRGGAHAIVSLDFETAEGELRQHDVPVPADLDDYFHREWVRSLLALAVDDLRVEYMRLGKTKQFGVFEAYDLLAPASGDAISYAALADSFGVQVTDVTNYLSAARRTFRRLLLDRLRSICADSGEFEAEARQLLRGGLR